MDIVETETTSYYEVLEIPPDASPQQIREAYLRSKSAYNNDSMALYSLVSAEEREDMIKKINEAYEVLSNEIKRKEYDQCHGLLEMCSAEVVSIDRVPPMETSSDSADDLLVPPATDFFEAALANPVVEVAPPIAPVAAVTLVASNGETLKQLRESRRISIEEMATQTKISKTYLKAVEAEDFKKLPAGVFVRGFVIQLCRVLKTPQDKILPEYMKRYYLARPEQAPTS